MSEIWSPQQANDWYARVSPIVGCNYLPRTAVNSTEMWQAESFDPETIDEELGWAAAAGYNSLRIFVQYLVWLHDPGRPAAAHGSPPVHRRGPRHHDDLHPL